MLLFSKLFPLSASNSFPSSSRSPKSPSTVDAGSQVSLYGCVAFHRDHDSLTFLNPNQDHPGLDHLVRLRFKICAYYNASEGVPGGLIYDNEGEAGVCGCCGGDDSGPVGQIWRD